MKTSTAGAAALKSREGLRAFAYPDPESALAKATPRASWGRMPARVIMRSLPAKVQELSASPWTVGYGQTWGVTIDTEMDEDAAERDLALHLTHYEDLVNAACTRKPTQGQFDALVSLAWNVEVAVSPKSSIIKAHNRGDWPAAARAFELYCKSGGREVPALLVRRKAEGADYLAASPVHQEDTTMADLSPQAVDAEKPMAASKINIAQAGAGAIASIGAVTEVLNAVGQLKEGVAGLGAWLLPAACIAVVALCVYTIWERMGLRKRGIV